MRPNRASGGVGWIVVAAALCLSSWAPAEQKRLFRSETVEGQVRELRTWLADRYKLDADGLPARYWAAALADKLKLKSLYVKRTEPVTGKNIGECLNLQRVQWAWEFYKPIGQAIDRSPIDDRAKELLRLQYAKTILWPQRQAKPRIDVRARCKLIAELPANTKAVTVWGDRTLEGAIREAYPAFAKLSAVRKQLVLRYLDRINHNIRLEYSFRCPEDQAPKRSPTSLGPDLAEATLDQRLFRIDSGLKPNGYDDQKQPCHTFVMPLGDGSARVWAYRIRPEGGVILPPADHLAAIAAPDELNLRNLWLITLDGVAELRPRSLILDGCDVKGLSAVSAMKALKRLSLAGTGVADLSPLKGLKLEFLDLRDTQVSDLSPLKGMPLKELILTRSKVKDLSPLAGAPLRHLRLWDAPATDLTPLRGMPLEYLQLKMGVKYAPAGLEVVRGLRTLERVSDFKKAKWFEGYRVRHSKEWFPAMRGDVETAGPVNELIYARRKDIAEKNQQARAAAEKARARQATPDEPYPRWRGRDGSGAAVDTDEETVPTLAGAKLLWKSDANIPGVHRMDGFRAEGMPGPAVLDPSTAGGFSSPVVAYGKVYVYYYVPSGEAYNEGACEEYTDKKFCIGRRAWWKDADEVLHCFDAYTGQTVWRRVLPRGGVNHNQYTGWKNGGHFTPCIADGKVYFLTTTSRMVCLDAEDGRPIWDSDVGRRHEISMQAREWWKTSDYGFAVNGGWCMGYCPAEADGVVTISDGIEFQGGPRNIGGSALVGFDGQTGRPMWKVPGAGGSLVSAMRWKHGQEEYVIAPGARGVHCIEPETGKVLWRLDPEDAPCKASPAVRGEYLVIGHQESTQGWRITPEKATKAWEVPGLRVAHPVPLIYRGQVYVVGRGATVLDLKTGEKLGEARLQTSSSSPVGFNGYVIQEAGGETPTALSLFGEPKLFGLTGPPLRAGCVNSVTSAVAYNRIYFRNRWRLMCFDLRRDTTQIDKHTAEACVELLFGEDEHVAEQAAAALQNVEPAARKVASDAFGKCIDDGREHLLSLGVRAALLRRKPDEKVVLAALGRAIKRGDKRAFIAILNAVPDGNPAFETIGGKMLPGVILGDQAELADTAVEYASQPASKAWPDAARKAVRKALVELIERDEWLTSGSLIEALAHDRAAMGKLEKRWHSSLASTMDRGKWGDAAGVLRAVPTDSPHVKADEFLPAALQCVKSCEAEGIGGGVSFLRGYGLEKVQGKDRREWVDALAASLKCKSVRAREAVVGMLASMGKSAKPAIPALRAVLMDKGMQKIASEAIRAIDPSAKVVKPPSQLELGEEGPGGLGLPDL